jgi:hypothetical protein
MEVNAMDDQDTFRQHLLDLLGRGQAHPEFEQVVRGFPHETINRRPPNLPYSPWRLLEHIRIAQWDILEFIRNPDHVSPHWPEGYWPAENERADEPRWAMTIAGIQADRQALAAIVADPETDLLTDLRHAAGYTILREILVVCDHNAYHLGELGLLREAMK